MSKPVRILAFLAVLSTCFSAGDRDRSGIHLLPGYSLKKGSEVDVNYWSIEKPGGLRINCEDGPGPPQASLKHKHEYAWYREQLIDGRTVVVALIKPGMKTEYEKYSRFQRKGLGPGNILIVSFPDKAQDSTWSSDCSAKVANSGEIVDMLLMALTFDASKMAGGPGASK